MSSHQAIPPGFSLDPTDGKEAKGFLQLSHITSPGFWLDLLEDREGILQSGSLWQATSPASLDSYSLDSVFQLPFDCIFTKPLLLRSNVTNWYFLSNVPLTYKLNLIALLSPFANGATSMYHNTCWAPLRIMPRITIPCNWICVNC